ARASCPPVEVPPPGYVPTTSFQTVHLNCCEITLQKYASSAFGCGIIGALCTNCLIACNCTYDPCCIHNCSSFAYCTCHPWISCGTIQPLFRWIVVATAPIDSVITVSILTNPQTHICSGTTSFSLSASVTGGLPAYSHTWNTGSVNHLINIAPQPAGVYIYALTVTDQNGCRDSSSVSIIVHSAPHAEFSSSSACEDVPVMFINSSYVNSDTITGYQWNFGNGLTSGLLSPMQTYSSS